MLRSVDVRPEVNSRWLRFFESRCLTMAPNPIIEPDDRIFTMGSCFAREVRFALRDLGLSVGPDLSAIPFEDNRYVIDYLPHEEHLNYYNSFTILQEFESVSGKWKQSFDDHWKLKRETRHGFLYQDPYKRMTFAKTPEDLHNAVTMVNDAIARSVKQARVFFFTLGMAEVFRKHDNGLIACQKPAYLGGGGKSETEFVSSSFSDNLESLEGTRSIIKSLNADAHIVVTVSPVPLERTFSGKDIVIANMEGKSILRAATAAFSDAHSDVTYFPAYELVTMSGERAYQDRDLRHVENHVVQMIMKAFVEAHVTGSAGP